MIRIKVHLLYPQSHGTENALDDPILIVCKVSFKKTCLLLMVAMDC